MTVTAVQSQAWHTEALSQGSITVVKNISSINASLLLTCCRTCSFTIDLQLENAKVHNNSCQKCIKHITNTLVQRITWGWQEDI